MAGRGLRKKYEDNCTSYSCCSSPSMLGAEGEYRGSGGNNTVFRWYDSRDDGQMSKLSVEKGRIKFADFMQNKRVEILKDE